MRHVISGTVVFVLLCSSAVAGTQAIQACSATATRSGASLRVNGSDNYLRVAPSASAERIVNAKATAALGRTTFAQIDNSTVVREECFEGHWSLVRVTEPEWLSTSHRGWVERKALRVPARDAGGTTVFTEADFSFDDKTRPYKSVIIAGVNKAHRDNPGCKIIDPTSAYISGSKGTKNDPVFYVTCGTGQNAFNVWFSKSDLEKKQ